MSDTFNKNREHTYFSWNKQENIFPKVIKKAKGIYLYDESDREIIDMSSQLVLANIGHGNESVLAAINNQMQKFSFVHPGIATDVRAELGEKLAKITPDGLVKTFFTLGGADANENAIKVARLFTGKQKIMTRMRSYHGGTYTTASAGGDPRRHLNQQNDPWVIRIPDPYHRRGALYEGKTPEEGDAILVKMIEEQILIENPDTIAAFLFEGYSGSSGVLQPTNVFFEGLQKLKEKYNILFIADEVMSGFGRTGKWFGIEHTPIKPDIMTMAKGMTGGYLPLGALITTKEIANHFEENMFNCGLTYSAHATSLAAAKAVIEVYEKEDLINKASENGKYLRSKLNELASKKENLGEVRGTGLHYCLDFVTDKKSMEPISPWNQPQNDYMKEVNKKIWENGLSTFSRWNWIFVTPPLTITKEQIDEMVNRLDKSI